MKILYRHPNGIEKRVKSGFSWTLLFFGVFVPLYRGDLKYALKYMFLGFLTFGIYTFLIAPFTYNKIYSEYLKEKGYTEFTEIEISQSI